MARDLLAERTPVESQPRDLLGDEEEAKDLLAPTFTQKAVGVAKGFYKAGARVPRTILATGEALQRGEPAGAAAAKAMMDFDKRTPTEIAHAMGDFLYHDKSQNVWWEAMKGLPFATLGTVASIFADPAIQLTFVGIGRALKEPHVAKFMAKPRPAPAWLDNMIKKTVEFSARPLANLSESVKAKRIDALVDEMYKNAGPKITENWKATTGETLTEADLRGLLKAELIKHGALGKSIREIQQALMRFRQANAPQPDIPRGVPGDVVPAPVPIKQFPKAAVVPANIKAMAAKSYTTAAFQALPVTTQSTILAEKLKGAKGAKHRAAINWKYKVTAPTAEPAAPFKIGDEVVTPDGYKGVVEVVSKDSAQVRTETGSMFTYAQNTLTPSVGAQPAAIAPETRAREEITKTYTYQNLGVLSSDIKATAKLLPVLRRRKGIEAEVKQTEAKLHSLLTLQQRLILEERGKSRLETSYDMAYRRAVPVKSEFKTPLTTQPTPAASTIETVSPAPQPTKAEKPKPLTTWATEDFPDDVLITKSDPATTHIVDSINDRIRKRMMKSVTDYRTGKNPYTLNHLIDTPIAFQQLEERTGFPLYTKYYAEGSKARNIIAFEVATTINKFTEGLKQGYQTSTSTERIVNWITKRGGSLTQEERKIATKLQDVFRQTKDIVSYLRMRRFIDGAEAVPKGMEKVVEEGEEVFVQGGREALEKWVKGRDIGVVTDDRYFPAQLLYRFRTHYSSDPFEVFNPHLRSREAKEQIYDYSQSIVQKLHSYLTRMYSDYYLYDLLMDAKADFSGVNMPYETINAVKKWLVAIQGKGVDVGWWGRAARKARGQFFKVTLADPTKMMRNYLQRYYMTLQNYPTLQHAIRTKQFFTYKMTPAEHGFFRRHVSQLRELEREQLYLYDKVFETGVLGKVDDLAIKCAHRYTLIDEGNRYTTFKYALATNDQYIKMYKQGTLNLHGFLTKVGASSFYDLEIKHLLSLPIEEARLGIAKLLVEKTQVRYKKTERGLSALSEAGEIATSLLQYPKGIITRYLDAVDMIGRGDSMAERWSGVRLLMGLIILANVAQDVLEAITGESRYYDPDLGREVVHDPYSLIGIIGSLQIAGAQPGHVVTLARAVKRISTLLYLDATRQVTDKDRRTSLRAILKDVDALGEAYIPFLRIAMNAVEAAGGTRSFKLLTTSFDNITRRQTALRRNKIERNWVDAWRHLLFGREGVQE